MPASMSNAAVRVDVTAGSRLSTIWIGNGVSERLPELLDAHGVGARRFVVSSPVIWRLHGARLQEALGRVEPILLPDGERYKNLQSVSRVYEALIKAGADRGSAIVAVGGGVIGDTAGFAAASFLRGITLAHASALSELNVLAAVIGALVSDSLQQAEYTALAFQRALVAGPPTLMPSSE